MQLPSWNWWFTTDAGLLARIGIGAVIFLLLATVDLIRHGRAARRWREYLFLLTVVAVAMMYGIANDSIASRISWEYFYYGKGLAGAAAPGAPADMAQLRWEACKLGLKASFSAGLIVGVAVLMANNPRRGRRQLAYVELCGAVGIVLICAAMGAAVGAWVGNRGGWNWTSSDLAAIWRQELFRPRRFMLVYGMNLGGYAGTAMGTAAVLVKILWRRRSGKEPRVTTVSVPLR